MIDKPLYIIIFMYVASVSFLGAQFMADSYGVTLQNPDGDPIESSLVDFVRIDTINEASTELLNSNETQFTLEPVFAGATIAWDLFQLLTGVYIFNLPYLFGVPTIYLVPIGIGYMFMLFNTIIAKIRGV